MDFEVITVFPELVSSVLPYGVTGRALSGQRYRVRCWNPRDVTTDNYRRIDDRPYGGGPGMVMMAEPLTRCLQAIRSKRSAEAEEGLAGAPAEAGATAGATAGGDAGGDPKQRAGAPLRVVCLSPQGAPLTQAKVKSISEGPGLILLCGRYEAIDQRFLDAHVDEEISVGDFVVSGGELPALLLIDAVVRLLPGVLNDTESAAQDSFVDGLLDCPHFTRPEVVDGIPVPPVLLSGNHREIERWRRQQALLATLKKRPDLLERARRNGRLSPLDHRTLEEGSCGGSALVPVAPGGS
jgi:tRNA (guanine37-N1)-methyltransferase